MSDQVAGSFRLDAVTFAKKLGRPAWDVFIALQWCRDYHGFSKVSNTKLLMIVNARRAREQRGPMSRSMLEKKALPRLRKLGLLSTLRQDGARAFVRRIIGYYKRGVVRVPREVALGVLGAWSKGGRRPGAGRPSSQHGANAGSSQKSKVEGTAVKGRRHSAFDVAFSEDPRSFTDHRTALRGSIRDLDLSSYEERTSSPTADQNQQEKTLGHGVKSEKARKEIRGTVEQDSFERAALEEKYPPPPTTKLLKVAKVPYPKLLPDGMSDAQAARVLAKLYKECAEAKLGAPTYLFARGDIRNSKHYRTLVDAAHTLRDLSIAPAAWIAWAFDMWSIVTQSEMIAPVRYVFKPERIIDRVNHFRAKENHCKGGQLKFNASALECIRRYRAWEGEMTRVRMQITNLGHTTNYGAPRSLAHEDVVQFIDALEEQLYRKHFPDGWQHYYRRAREDGDSDQIEYWRMLDDWQFLW